MPLTTRERAQLRNRIARRAVLIGAKNPLITKQEHEEEMLNVGLLFLEGQKEPESWLRRNRMLTRKDKIDLGEEIAA